MAENRCKYYKQKKQVSYDNGVTWQDVVPAEYQKGELYEQESADCGYVPPTPTGKKYALTLPSGVLSVDCDGSTVITNTESRYFPNNGCLYAVDIGDCVTSIGENAFHCCTRLSSATIPDSVTSIGDWAFESTDLLMVNSNINGICNLPKYLEHIGARAFGGGHKLIKINIPDSVTSIGNSAFTWCTRLTSVGSKGSNASIEIPNNITSLSEAIFAHCSGLTSVTIPNTVTSIGIRAFEGCTSLTSLTIGNGVTSIGRYAFGDCSGLTNVTIGNNVTTIGDNAFRRCSSLTSVTIPNNITSIEDYAFGDCSGLTNVTIPNSVTSISDGTFAYCYGLTSVTIPDSVTSIGERAFYVCRSLTSMTVNATTPPTLGTDALYNTNDCPIYVPCESVNAYKTAWSAYSSRIQCIPPVAITKLAATYTGGTTRWVECNENPTLTSGETRGGVYSYSAMTSAVIGQCVTSIGDRAFINCYNLTSIDTPNSVTSIGSSAFLQCYRFTGVTIPNSVTSIGERAFSSCESLTSINIPSGVTSIGNSAFYNCRSLTSISIPSGITVISDGVFQECTGLTSVNSNTDGECNIPSGVTSIGEDAFFNCKRLTSVNIPSGVTSIGDSAFNYCTSLTSMTVNATTPPTLGYHALYHTSENLVIYVPCDSVADYKEYWSDYSSYIQGIPPCEPKPQYRWVDMDISVDYYCEGTTKYYKKKKQVSYDYGQTWQDVTPPEYQKGGVAEEQSTDCGYIPPTPTNKKLVANYSDGKTLEVECNSSGALTSGETQPSGYQYSAMTTAIIGDCVTRIRNNAFSGFTSLTSIVISNSVTSISTSTFARCSSLTSVIIGNGVTSIGNSAFYSGTSLTSITINATTPPTLGNNVFTYTNNCPIYVPASSVNAYKSASGWSTYADRIQPIQ